MGMHQAGNGASLGKKVFHIIAGYASVEDFNGSQSIQVDMLTQVDFGETALS